VAFACAPSARLFWRWLLTNHPLCGRYVQGMGYLTGFLLLLVPPNEVASILHCIGTDELYTPGYWKGQPEAFVRDALVYQELIRKRLPV
jgi:hypothetical protein